MASHFDIIGPLVWCGGLGPFYSRLQMGLGDGGSLPEWWWR